MVAVAGVDRAVVIDVLAEGAPGRAGTQRNRIAVVELEADGPAGRVRKFIDSTAYTFPTAVAVRDDRLLVVNSQLDKMGRAPQLPFTVVAIERTDG